MESKRNEKIHYEWTKDGNLKSVWTKTITAVKNKEEIQSEIGSLKNFIKANKSKIKSIANERKNLKEERKINLMNIETCEKRIRELQKYLGKWGSPKPPK